MIIEGLNLSAVPPANTRWYALPLNLQDADGAPTRVILIKLTMQIQRHQGERSAGFPGQSDG